MKYLFYIALLLFSGGAIAQSGTLYPPNTISGNPNSFAAAPRALSALDGGVLDNVFYQQLLTNGAKFDDSTDDGPAWQTTLNACTLTVRCQAYLPPGLTSKINTGFSITTGATSFNGNGVTLDASGMTTGCVTSGSNCAAVLITAASTTLGGFSSNDFTSSAPIENFRLVGPTSTSVNVDGVVIAGNGTKVVSDQTIRNINVRGFRDGIALGNYAYVDYLFGLHSLNNWRYGINLSAATQSAENISCTGCNFSNNNFPVAVTFTGTLSSGATSGTLAGNWTQPTATYPVKFSTGEIQPVLLTNGATTANWSAYGAGLSSNETATASTTSGGIAIFMANAESGAEEFNCIVCSIDYNDIAFSVQGGVLRLTGGHVEDNHYQAALGYVNENSGTASAVYLDPSTITLFDAAPARSVVISTSANSVVQARTRWATYSLPATLISTSSTAIASIAGSFVNFNGTSANNTSTDNWPSLGPLFNLLGNSNFVGSGTGSNQGWSTSGTNWTWTTAATSSEPSVVWPATATFYTQAVSTGTNAGQILQNQPCHSGQELTYRTWVYTPTFTSGHLNFSISFLDASGLITVSTSSFNWTTANEPTTAPVVIHGQLTVPPGAAQCQFNLGGPAGGNAFSGTVQMTNAEMDIF